MYIFAGARMKFLFICFFRDPDRMSECQQFLVCDLRQPEMNMEIRNMFLKLTWLRYLIVFVIAHCEYAGDVSEQASERARLRILLSIFGS